MTTEIAVLNKSAVALAADSAVTISNAGSVKVYNSANKLFALSKHHPVGVMVFGNAELLGLSWETLIKRYRSQLGDRCYSSLDGYVEEFIQFIDGNAARFFPDYAQNEYVKSTANALFGILAGSVDSKIRDIVDNGSQIDAEITRNLVSEELAISIQKQQNAPFLSELDDDFRDQITEEYGQICDDVAKQLFPPDVCNQVISDAFRELVMEALVRQSMGNENSGIVIAGYGCDDLFPGVRCLLFDGILLDKVLWTIDARKQASVSLQDTARVIAFAQDDMTRLFMEGIDLNYQLYLYNVLAETFKRVPAMLVSAIQQTGIQIGELGDDLDSIIHDSLDEIIKKSVGYMREVHIAPIMDTVGLMSKDELAVMAETLVNLTAFKRRITMVTETVGGPIDVAVISRGDGLIWIKRKLYFDPQLNHQFFDNYYK